MKIEVSQETVKRLRESAAENAKSEHEEGFANGVEWASNDADASELRLLEMGGSIIGLAGEDGVEVFWDTVLGPDWKEEFTVTDHFVKGFENGAKAVWAEAKRQF